MKHFFTLFASLLFTATFAQQPLIAIKGTTTDAIATTLEQAISIAQPNDKIYLPGGTYTLNDSIQKPVHIIGTGYNDLIERQLPITVFEGNINIGSQSQGLIIEGIKNNNTIFNKANNVILRKINANQVINYAQSIYVYNSYIGTLFDSRNTIVLNSVVGSILKVTHLTITNSIILYFKNGAWSTNDIYSASYNSQFNNCIFRQVDNLLWGNNTFVNSYQSTSTADFNNYFNNNNNDVFNLNADLNVSSSAPIQNIGIYFGTYPWKNGGQPINPHITANTSFLDVQNEQFKLKVKVIPQTN